MTTISWPTPGPIVAARTRDRTETTSVMRARSSSQRVNRSAVFMMVLAWSSRESNRRPWPVETSQGRRRCSRQELVVGRLLGIEGEVIVVVAPSYAFAVVPGRFARKQRVS